MPAFMKIGSIQGESKDSRHDKWIDVLSVSMGVRNDGGGGKGRTAGRPEFSAITCMKRMDQSSPFLMLAAASGQVFARAVIEFFDDDSNDGTARQRASVTCGDVVCVSVRLQDTADDGEPPREEVSLNFEKIEWSYETTKGDTVSTGWDLAKNRPV